MSFALCFYVLMIVWLVFGFFANPAPRNLNSVGGSLLLFVLFLLLGWKVFGPPLHQ